MEAFKIHPFISTFHLNVIHHTTCFKAVIQNPEELLASRQSVIIFLPCCETGGDTIKTIHVLANYIIYIFNVIRVGRSMLHSC